MARENAPPTLGELARRQWGVVTRDQLRAAGLGDTGVRDWVRDGRLHRLHRGVYAYGHDRLKVEGHWLAAVLACGPGAVLSHRSAGRLWEVRQNNAALIDVTVPSRNGRIRRAGIRVHRSRRLGAEEITERDGIPVTTLARTLLDLADVIHPQGLKRAITEAEYRGRFDLTSLTAVVQNNPGRRGAKVMRAAEHAGIGPGRPSRTASSHSRTSGVSRDLSQMCGSRVTRWTFYGEELALWWSWMGLRSMGPGRL
jgi:hypothetical protein